MIPNLPTYRALRDVRLHTADVTRLRAEIRATAPAAIGEAADELMSI